MNNRVSNVGNIKVSRCGNPSVFEIGDSEQMNPLSYVIAAQREQAVFKQNEFNFADYSLFSRPFLQPVANEQINMTTVHECPEIRVKSIDIFSLTSSSVVHIGSSQRLKSETRIKHVRHLLRQRPEIL